MKSKISLCIMVLFAAIVSFFLSVCEASAEVSGYFSGDDEVWVWGYDSNGNWAGSGWWRGPDDGDPNYDEWRTADLLPDNPQAPYLYFAVRNIEEVIPGTHPYPPGEYNPAGFLASFSTSGGVFEETQNAKLLSDVAHWKVVAHDGWEGDPTFDPTELEDWGPPESWGANDDPDTLWYQVNWNNPVGNIDGDAEWIWTGNNFDPEMDNYAVFRARMTVIPEPATMLLFGLGGLTAAFFRKNLLR